MSHLWDGRFWLSSQVLYFTELLFHLRNKGFLVLLSHRENWVGGGHRFKQIWFNLRLQEVQKCVSIQVSFILCFTPFQRNVSFKILILATSVPILWFPQLHIEMVSAWFHSSFWRTTALPHSHQFLIFIMRRREGWCNLFLSGYIWVPPLFTPLIREPP